MEHSHGHPEHAPRMRFRGRRRYFRRVHRKAAAFELVITPHGWWNFWHYHADWPGWGNVRWRYRREHLRALCRVFETIANARDRFATPFQLWILVSGDDAGQDSTYLHTPNPHDSPFPFAPSLEPAEPSSLTEALATMLPGFALEHATNTDDDGHITHWTWARGVGESLSSER